jgi:hypothetical protein
VEQRDGVAGVWAAGLGNLAWGLPKGLASVGSTSPRPTLSIPSSPTARLVLSFSFSFSHQPATFVSRQLTGSSRGPLWSTESFSVNIVADPCPCRRLGNTRCPMLEDQPVRPSLPVPDILLSFIRFLRRWQTSL